MSVFRVTTTAVACAALVLIGQQAVAAPPPGTPCVDDGHTRRYLVLFDRGLPQADAARRVAAACGDTSAYYPAIGVAVATSDDHEFAERIGDARAVDTGRDRIDTRVLAQPGSPRRVPAEGGDTGAWTMRAINAAPARLLEPGSRDVVAGVLDSGVDRTHPDLADAVDPKLSTNCLSGAARATGAAAPTTPHGTHVAGIIAAAGEASGMTGVAPGIRIASVTVVDEHGRVSPGAAVCGLMWAARHEMTVANASFLVAPVPAGCAGDRDGDVVHDALARAVGYATAAGTLTVTAATNSGADLAGEVGHTRSCATLPAALREVVTVSAVGPDLVKAGYSAYGLGVMDLTAPGGGHGRCVRSTVPGGYDTLCGTSMAAPHVSGVAALVASAHPGYSPKQLRATLSRSAAPVACPADYDLTGDGMQDGYCAGYREYNGFYGHGMVDALAAVTG